MEEGEGLVLRLDKPISKQSNLNNELVTWLVNIKEFSTIIIVHRLLQFNSHTSLTTLDQNLTFA